MNGWREGGTDLSFGHFPLAGLAGGVAVGDLVHADPFGRFVRLDGFSDQSYVVWKRFGQRGTSGSMLRTFASRGEYVDLELDMMAVS